MPATASIDSPNARQGLERDLVARRNRAGRAAPPSLDEALSPLAVLARGYSLTFLADGKTLVRNSLDVSSGDLIYTPARQRARSASQVHLSPPSLAWPTPGS